VGLNKFEPHLLILSEDRAFHDIALGFKEAIGVDSNVRVEPSRGGRKDLESYVRCQLESLSKFHHRILVVLFDGDANAHRGVPQPLNFGKTEYPSDRVFFLSTVNEAEDLRSEFLTNKWLNPNKLKEIGCLLAKDCENDDSKYWSAKQLASCSETLPQLRKAVRSILGL
jgi:hypothetical protein